MPVLKPSYYPILIALLAVFCFTSAAGNKQVLQINSYNSSYPIFYQHVEGVKSVLSEEHFDIHMEFMDTKRFVDSTNIQQFKKRISYKLKHMPPLDGVIACDDNAFNFVRKYQNELFKSVPIVFCGVNNIKEAKKRIPNITGVAESKSFLETAQLMIELFNQNDSIYVISDNSVSGKADLNSFLSKANSLAKPISIINLAEIDFNTFFNKLESISYNAPILLLSALIDVEGKSLKFNESLERITKHCNSPIFHLGQHGIGRGIIGGKIISQIDHSRAAAKKLVEVLEGKNIDEIDIQTKNINNYYFDYNLLKKHNIKHSQLPPDAIFINKPNLLYKRQYRIIAISVGIIIVLIAFVSALYFNIRKHRKIEHKLLEQNLQYKALSSKHNKNEKLLEESIRIAEENEKRYRYLFDNNPISLWEEDLTEVKELLNMTANSVEDLESYIDNNPIFVKSCIRKMNINRVNSATVKLFGYSSKQELIANMSNTFNDNSYRVFKSILKSIHKNQDIAIEEGEYIKKDGSVLTAIIHTFSNNNFSSTIVAIVDTTNLTKMQNALAEKLIELKNSELVLLRKNNELIEATRKAEQSDSLKTEFINNMSHEIRTPMNGILGFADLLSKPDVKPENAKNYITIIKNCGQQLLRIIDDILEISRLETKQVKTSNAPFNLNDLLLENFSIFDMDAKNRKLPFYLKKGLSDEDAQIISDKSKLNKIISNLIENSLKFTRQGYIELGYYKEADTLKIYVKDTGSGISKDKQNAIFERFTQEEKDSNDAIGGLGLGLSIAKENSEIIGGSITLESEKGKGAKFTITIPYVRANPEKENELQEEHKIHILIAEDEEVNYLFLEIVFDEHPDYEFILYHAKNGLEAVNILEKHPEIQMVLMDLKMPVMSGFEAINAIRSGGNQVPIIAQTAYTGNEEKRLAKESGCNDIVTKPVNKVDLFNKIKETLKL